MSQTRNLTLGIDVGDQVSVLGGVDAAGQVIQRGQIRTTAAAFQRHFAAWWAAHTDDNQRDKGLVLRGYLSHR